MTGAGCLSGYAAHACLCHVSNSDAASEGPGGAQTGVKTTLSSRVAITPSATTVYGGGFMSKANNNISGSGVGGARFASGYVSPTRFVSLALSSNDNGGLATAARNANPASLTLSDTHSHSQSIAPSQPPSLGSQLAPTTNYTAVRTLSLAGSAGAADTPAQLSSSAAIVTTTAGVGGVIVAGDSLDNYNINNNACVMQRPATAGAGGLASFNFDGGDSSAMTGPPGGGTYGDYSVTEDTASIYPVNDNDDDDYEDDNNNDDDEDECDDQRGAGSKLNHSTHNPGGITSAWSSHGVNAGTTAANAAAAVGVEFRINKHASYDAPATMGAGHPRTDTDVETLNSSGALARRNVFVNAPSSPSLGPAFGRAVGGIGSAFTRNVPSGACTPASAAAVAAAAAAAASGANSCQLFEVSRRHSASPMASATGSNGASPSSTKAGLCMVTPAKAPSASGRALSYVMPLQAPVYSNAANMAAAAAAACASAGAPAPAPLVSDSTRSLPAVARVLPLSVSANMCNDTTPTNSPTNGVLAAAAALAAGNGVSLGHNGGLPFAGTIDGVPGHKSFFARSSAGTGYPTMNNNNNNNNNSCSLPANSGTMIPPLLGTANGAPHVPPAPVPAPIQSVQSNNVPQVPS